MWWLSAYYGLRHALGFDSQATMAYAFVSGIGPMLLTAIGMSTLIAGAWHHLNCHETGCWWVGRHKVNGTPYCNRHHGNARAEVATDELLRQLIGRLDRLLDRL